MRNVMLHDGSVIVGRNMATKEFVLNVVGKILAM